MHEIHKYHTIDWCRCFRLQVTAIANLKANWQTIVRDVAKRNLRYLWRAVATIAPIVVVSVVYLLASGTSPITIWRLSCALTPFLVLMLVAQPVYLILRNDRPLY